MLPDGKIADFSEDEKAEVKLLVEKMSLAGKRLRLIILSPEKITKDGVFPDNNRIFAGFICFHDKISAEVKKSAKTFIENGISLKVISYENPEYNRFVKNELGVEGLFGSGVLFVQKPSDIGVYTENIGGTVIAAFDSAANLASVTLAPRADGIVSRKVIPFCGKFSEISCRKFSDFAANDLSGISETLSSGVTFSTAVKIICAVMICLIIMTFLMFAFWLTSLPVPFADSIVPSVLLLGLIQGLMNILVLLKMKI
jgi:magnesium-transporting ATPase (P-type)